MQCMRYVSYANKCFAHSALDYFFPFSIAVLSGIITLMLLCQIPDVKTGNERIDAVVVDEESVGSVDAPGCGGKILHGDGALEHYLAENKLKDSVV